MMGLEHSINKTYISDTAARYPCESNKVEGTEELVNLSIHDISSKLEECNIENCVVQIQSAFLLHQDMIRKLQSENENISKLSKQLAEENKTLHAELTRLRESSKGSICDCHCSAKRHETQPLMKQPKKLVTYYIRRKESDVTFYSVAMKFLSKIQDKLKPSQVELNFDSWDELSADKPLVVCCVNASRLGTVVEHALSNISGSPKIILIILHHRAPHDCKLYASSETVLHTLKKDVQLIIDVVFWQTDGVYDCDVNSKAVLKFVNYVSACP